MVQVVAWGRMFAGYARAMSFSKAAERTLSGEMCGLCRAVASAKKSEPPPVESAAGKMKLVLFQETVPGEFVVATADDRAPIREQRAGGCLRASPPTPPPRAA